MTTLAESVTFTDSDHSYRLGGRVLPSVTQVIGSVLPGWKADEWYMQKGTAMHHGCRLMDEGRLDWSSVAPEIEGRLRAWEKFRADFPSETVAAELPMSHPSLQFAGTLDRVFEVGGERIIADIKSTICPQVRLQLAAYSMLWFPRSDGRASDEIRRGVAVELRDNGTYSTLWMNKRELDLAARTFLAALTIFNFKRKEGMP